MANKNLNAAKTAKKDEFYTQLTDIERELEHYWQHFEGKVVLCNCDDPYESNFFKYFALRFNQLKLRKLICTCYNGSPVQGNELSLQFEGDEEPKRKAYKVVITEVKDMNGDGAVDLSDVRILLQNDKNAISTLKTGDFRDPECIELLKQADIVVTNPPFSLFREYIAQLMEYKKKFLIIGNKASIHYKEIFPLIKENKLWVGYTPMSKDLLFNVPQESVNDYLKNGRLGSNYKIVDGIIYGRSPSIWFTNLDHSKRHEEIDLYRHYYPEAYKSYYNYDAIDVSELSEIPCDFEGYMGVPDTILGQFNPEQFELIGMASDVPKKYTHESIEGKTIVFKDGDKIIWSTPYTVAERKLGNSLRLDINGEPGSAPYSRIIIRNKKPKKI